MRKWLFISFLILRTAVVYAQDIETIKIQSAEKVDWSGGIAGRMGTNYSVNLTWNSAISIKIDSVWCDGLGYAINHVYKGSKSNKPLKIQYQLTFTEDKSTYGYRPDNPYDDSDNPPGFKKTHTRKPPIAYKGKILIRYITADKKKHYLVVKTFTKTSIVSYP